MFPDPKFLAKVGWAIFLGGMYGVVCFFVLQGPFGMNTPWPYLLMAGAALVIFFTSPSWNLLKTVALGLANFPLSAMSTFSDIMSYVRLMAVGLAGSVLAVSFNELAVKAGPILVVPIALFGHFLNVGLCLIALFSHGVRLNVLEFSNNFGLEWSGYPYQPFGRKQPQEN
jgi:V/A-type H+-transporting ATPase subunit I